MEFDFDKPITTPAIQPEPEPFGTIVAFPLARHFASSRLLGEELRAIPTIEERRKLWGKRTGALIRSRIACGLSREVAEADVSAWADLAREEYRNPLPCFQKPSRFEALLPFPSHDQDEPHARQAQA
ncbi:hypothetical protein [Brucella grignonensis]|nr:hypothetical protein [Brucella grignonensis]